MTPPTDTSALKPLPQGTYFLQLISNNQLITRKVLKK